MARKTNKELKQKSDKVVSMDQRPGETPLHMKAFEYYYSLGDIRSLSKVAEQFGVTRATVTRWNRKFNWQERIQERDRKVEQLLEEEAIQDAKAAKQQYRAIIQATVRKFVEKLSTGQIEVKKIEDLERLVKLDLLLMGEATERGENYNVNESVKDARKKLAKELYKKFGETEDARADNGSNQQNG